VTEHVLSFVTYLEYLQNIEIQEWSSNSLLKSLRKRHESFIQENDWLYLQRSQRYSMGKKHCLESLREIMRKIASSNNIIQG